jgi:hypothetical protein
VSIESSNSPLWFHPQTMMIDSTIANRRKFSDGARRGSQAESSLVHGGNNNNNNTNNKKKDAALSFVRFP